MLRGGGFTHIETPLQFKGPDHASIYISGEGDPAPRDEIDEYVKDLQVDIWQEFQNIKQDKYEGKPVFYLQSLLRTYLLGDDRTAPQNFMFVRKHEISLYDSYFQLGLAPDG